jgi:Protein of unknown function (DUF1566)
MNIAIRMMAIAVGAIWLCSSLVAGAECDASLAKESAASRFTVNGETVHDKKTDLTWARCGRGQQWKEADGCVGELQKLTYSQSHAGLSNGWRLPSVEELKTIIAPHCSNPAVDGEIFPSTVSDWYRTGTKEALNCLLLNFADGRVDRGWKLCSYPYSVRLVRDGK